MVADSCLSFCIAIGGPDDDQIRKLIQTTDGGFVGVGWTRSFGQGNYDVYVVKISATGQLQWTKTIGGPNEDFGRAIIQTTDGGYAITGHTTSFGQGGHDVYVIKLSATGNLQWTRTIGGPQWDEGYDLIQTPDGGYVVVGFTSSFGQGNYDVYVAKLDSVGNLQWTRTIGGTSIDWGYSIVQTTDGGYAITGVTASFGQGSYDGYVVKLNANGVLQWTRTIGGTAHDWCFSLVQTTDNGYALACRTTSFGQGSMDVYIVKLNSAGGIQWTKTVGGSGNEEAHSIIQSINGGFLIAGYTSSFGQGGYDVYIIKLDALGNLQWTRTIGGNNDDWGLSIVQASNGGAAIGGITQSFGLGSWDAYVINLDASGNLITCPNGCQLSTGGNLNSGGTIGSGGLISSGGTVSSGGTTSSGGTLTNICP